MAWHGGAAWLRWQRAWELLGFGTCGSWVWLTPLYPLAVLGWSLGMCCVSPSMSCDLSHLRARCGGGEERGAGGCWYVHRPWEALPVPLLSSEVRMWLPRPDLWQALVKPPATAGAVQAPVTAEPSCVASGRQWHRLPACLYPNFQAVQLPAAPPVLHKAHCIECGHIQLSFAKHCSCLLPCCGASM